MNLKHLKAALVASLLLGACDKIATQPDRAAAERELSLADAQFSVPDYKRAIQCCDKAIEKDSTYAKAYYRRAIAQIQQHGSRTIAVAGGFLGYAIVAGQDLDKAIEADPKYSEAYYQRGLSFEAAKETNKALADYSKALELLPPDAPEPPTDLEDQLRTGELPPVHGITRHYREELQERIKNLKSSTPK